MTTLEVPVFRPEARPVFTEGDGVRVLIDPDDALRLVVETAETRPPRHVRLVEACGRRLAQEVRADRSYPPWPRVMMDGYAVRLADAGSTVEVIGEVAAGQSRAPTVTPGQCLEIMTGAARPPGAEAVVPKEHVRRHGRWVQLPKQIPLGAHIAPQGSECAAGALVLRPGDPVTPLAVAVMASFGVERVLVTPWPSLAVITTGTELVPGRQTPHSHQIRDSNGPMLVAMAQGMGLDSPHRLHVDDRPDVAVHTPV